MPSREVRLRAHWPDEPPRGTHWGVQSVAVDGNRAYVSGQVAFRGAEVPILGTVGRDVTTEEAANEAARCAANGIYRLLQECGSLDDVSRALRVTVYVNAIAGFTEQPAVADGASRVLVDVFGQAGKHARAAVGVASLPLGVPVEVELLVQLSAVYEQEA